MAGKNNKSNGITKIGNGVQGREILGEIFGYYYDISRADNIAIDEAIYHHREWLREDLGPIDQSGNLRTGANWKMIMLNLIANHFNSIGMEFDRLNGLAPTRANAYMAYEFTTLLVWTVLLNASQDTEWGRKLIMKDEKTTKKFKNCFAKSIASVFRKYPKFTGSLICDLDLKLPGNPIMDYAKVEDGEFDDDHTDEYATDKKAEEFKNWIMCWCADATEKDKMRVKNWFETKKSHKQIFAEIQKVVGNTQKFNSRLALFVERLFNQEGLDYFFEKTGFESKEDMFMAYFDKLTFFDEDTKRSFIKKYLV